MGNEFGLELKKRIIESGLAQRYGIFAFRGCTDEDIDEAASYQGVEFLPKIYKEFMRELGDNAGPLFPSDAYYYCSAVKYNKETAVEILSEDDSNLRLPEDAFVFITIQAHYFVFFHTGDKQDDPPVFEHYEGSVVFTLINQTLSGYYYSQIDEKHRILDELQRQSGRKADNE